MRTMMRSVLAGAAAVLLPGLATGQTIQERLSSLEKKVAEQAKGVSGGLFDIHALIAADYMYSINNPDSHTTQLRVFDEDANTFSLNQATLRFSRQREDEDVGGVVTLDFGKAAEVVGRVTNWSHASSSESSDSFEVREAFITYNAPLGDGVTFKLGKFVTLHGAEIIKDPIGGINPSLSNSFLFGYAIPFTHTGLMASFPAGDYLSFDLGVVNGWDNAIDVNDGKSMHAGIKVVPSDIFNVYVSGSYGTEQVDDIGERDGGTSYRGFVGLVATLNATEQLQFIADLNYGNESDLVVDKDGDEAGADWYGAALYAIFKVDDRLSFSLRGEVFDDPDGVRTGLTADHDLSGEVSLVGYQKGVTVWEFTPGAAYKLTDNLTLRAEYRHDEASRPVFGTDDSHRQSGQDTIAMEAVYAF